MTFDPGTSVHIASHTSSLAHNKGDNSWVLQSEERIKEASRNSTIWCEECLLGVQQCGLYDSQQHSHKFKFRTLTQVACSLS